MERLTQTESIRPSQRGEAVRYWKSAEAMVQEVRV